MREEFDIVGKLYQDIVGPNSMDLSVEGLASLKHPQIILSLPIRNILIQEYENSIAVSSHKVKYQAHWNSVIKNPAAKVFTAAPLTKSKQVGRIVYATMIRNFLGMSSLGLESDGKINCGFCDKVIESNSSHDLDCKKNGVIRRHDAIRDCLGSLCKAACIGVKIEQSGLSQKTRERPADIFIPNWKDGKDAWVDVAVINSSCASNLKYSSRTIDYALSKAQKIKEENYKILVSENEAIFIPFILDVNGRLNQLGEEFLARLASLGSSRHGPSANNLLSNSRLILSFKVLTIVAQQVNNAALSRLSAEK